MNQTSEKGKKKANFGSDFGLFGSNLDPQNYVVGFTPTRC